DVSYFRPSEQRASASTRTRHVILFVGRVSPEKGLHTLIEAFSEVATRFADVELRIAGPHSPLPADFLTSLSSDPRVTALSRFYDRWGNCKYREHLEELIESHGLRDRVH
ncbi:MAG: glycosyltransferase family 4 protein, partial [Mesorhizobium sp.]